MGVYYFKVIFMDIYRNRYRGVPWFTVVILMLLAACIAGAAVFFWQVPVANSRYEENKRLSEELNNVKSENESLQQQKAQLEKDLKAAQSQIPSGVAKGPRETVQDLADQVLHTLKDKDMTGFTKFVHPDKGVRFTPYSYVDTSKNVVIPAAEVPGLMADTNKRVWGAFDGTGDPIDMPFSEYYNRFVYDFDFLEAPDTVYNLPVSRGNSLVNVKEAYPNAVFIEYYTPGADPQNNGMDWKSLRLVFEQKDGSWYLVGIVHDQWTI